MIEVDQQASELSELSELSDWSAAEMSTVVAAREVLAQESKDLGGRSGSWIESVRWPPLPNELKDRLSQLANTCVSLGDEELATFLLRLCDSTDSEHQYGGARLSVLGGQGRQVEILACDPRIPILPVARLAVVDIRSPRQEIDISARESLIVRVSTRRDEPPATVPVWSPPDDVVQIDLSSLRPVSAPVRMRFIPPTRGRVGGDLLARNVLPTADVEVGPLLVQESPISVVEFVRLGGDAQQCSFLGKKLFDDQLMPRKGVLPSRPSLGTEFPVVGLDLHDVVRFIEAIPAPDFGSWALLADNEWEVLFSGPEHLVFPWGNRWIDGAANVLASQGAAIEASGGRPLDRSRFGLRDGGGNVEEWTAPAREVIARGGSWYNDKQISRCASRVVRASDYRHAKLGFRLALRL